METLTATPGAQLRAWRLRQAPKLTLVAAAAQVGVAHPTWIDWENGNRTPSLEKALAIELATGGEIRAEAWGIDPQRVEDIERAIARRSADPVEDITPTPGTGAAA